MAASRAAYCHETKAPRGVLCHSCNVGLGLFRESAERLEAAAAYLRNPTIKEQTA